MNEQLLKTLGADVLSSRKKPYGGGIHPRLYVPGLIYTQHIFFIES